MNFFSFVSFLFLFWQSARRGSNDGIPAAALTILFTLLIAGFVIALIVGLIIYSRKMREKRIKALQLFAAQNGWTFVPGASLRQTFPTANAYGVLNHSRGDLIALLQRQHDGGTAYLFDYAYTVGSGKHQQTYTQTVIAFHTPRLMIPFFALYPESFFSFIGEMFGYNDIDFATHPQFSKRFKLSGRDEMPIRSFFHPQVLSFFENVPNIRLDGGGNYLFVYIHNQTFQPEALNGFLNTALHIYNLFRR
ncbi:MAG: hypothetical protein M3384_14960 [Acidobacteriota bacterium]|nr:hypothetical protein [Acidobacteriota bacterium]